MRVCLCVCVRVRACSPTEWLTQAALISMTHSDQFKPYHVASIRGLRLLNVSSAAVLSNAVTRTGSWRFYNFLGGWVGWAGTYVGSLAHACWHCRMILRT